MDAKNVDELLKQWNYWEPISTKHTDFMEGTFIRRYQKLTHHFVQVSRYADKKVMGRRAFNDRLADMIRGGAPFMVTRFGYTECRVVANHIHDVLFNNGEPTEETRRHFNLLCSGAGFFPSDISQIDDFVNLYIGETIGEADILAVWDLWMEQFLIHAYMKPDLELTHLYKLEPWLASNPWSQALEGKKVLVIHPFTDTIRDQYDHKREVIFKDPKVLPKFGLKTLKAVQTIAGERDERFGTWFEALDYMTDEALKIDFDIAIIGCGAYGMPLAARMKRAGKQAVHLGGATQLMFGIRGKRWEDNYKTKIASLMNDNWVYPSESERPKNASVVENGCYW